MADQLILEFEEWRKIQAYPGYEVSSLGRVRSLDRIIYVQPGGRVRARMRPLKGKVLKPWFSLGYPCATLSDQSKHRIHTLVCEAFHGPRPTPEHEVAHNDGSRDNNFADNLRWATHAENIADRIPHGTENRGEKNGCSVLNREQVRQIRNKDGRHSDIASEFNISAATVSDIKRGMTWYWLE